MELRRSGVRQVRSLAFSSRGWLAVAGYPTRANGLVLWRNPLGDSESRIVPPLADFDLGWQSVRFSDDGNWLALGGANGIVLVWDIASPSAGLPEPLVLEAHGGVVWALAFDPSNSLLATGGDDALARVWRLTDLDAEPVAIRFGDEVRALGFDRDGKRLAIGGDSGKLAIVLVDPDEMAGHLCGRAARGLTEQEWAQLVGDKLPLSATCP